MKDWQDKVLEYGFAFGSQADKLVGKEFKVATTLGAPEKLYQLDGMLQTTLSDILKPLQTMSLFTRMIFTPTFVVYGALSISDEMLEEKAQEYKKILTESNW